MDPSNTPSFSLGRKFRVGAQVTLTVILVAAVVVMVNYLAGRYFVRIPLSPATSSQLSSRTLGLVKSITNAVQVTLFYDQDDGLYPNISSLLKEYHINNPRISIHPVDYLKDAAEAEQVKVDYHFPTNMFDKEKNWVIFASDSATNAIPGKALGAYTYEEERQGTNDPEYTRKLVGFKGEMMFSAMLFSITQTNRLTAYFLQGHGEGNPANDKDEIGYNKFASLIQANFIVPHFLSLEGTNEIPHDCSLLIVMGPTEPIKDDQLAKISQYLTEGGRLFALFNVYSLKHPTGLEKVLASWGVNVGNYVVRDPDNTFSGIDIKVTRYSKHPLVSSLDSSPLELVYPRAISAIDPNVQIADAPKVEEIAFTAADAFEQGNPSPAKRVFPLMVAVEKSAPSGVVTDRGSTRIVVVGDSIFLDNQLIEANPFHKDFANSALNWLLDRSVMLQGLGPRPVTEYHVMLTTSQMSALQWVLLGAIPGGLLCFGGLVWLRRRK